MKKQNATDAYIAAVAAISETLEALKAYAVDDHMGVSPDAVLSLLNEAAKFAGC